VTEKRAKSHNHTDYEGFDGLRCLTAKPWASGLIDTTSVVLTDGDKDLVTKLAQRLHTEWCEGLRTEGWQYGPRQSYAARTHPRLVAFDKLDEDEQEDCLLVSREFVKALLKEGGELSCKPRAQGP